MGTPSMNVQPHETHLGPRQVKWNTRRIRNYNQTSNINRGLVGNKITDHSVAVGASPVGAAPTTSRG